MAILDQTRPLSGRSPRSTRAPARRGNSSASCWRPYGEQIPYVALRAPQLMAALKRIASPRADPRNSRPRTAEEIEMLTRSPYRSETAGAVRSHVKHDHPVSPDSNGGERSLGCLWHREASSMVGPVRFAYFGVLLCEDAARRLPVSPSRSLLKNRS